ncbi:LOW QUALITY PROTEIN: hypothetical protein T552_04068 [Pneumocystis carinii B80]|uniref:Uncharacterized protein n=1 Tax=Pneumocystis carinii (strain B80) TaxID=1408658 RepID=A0A0W4ZQP6_PNEC8|nr:LOW QUALITY PROTEIN: hypothetical protein T552_04068 [Pneumocystis carinii B80]KTW30695.1 LOW QUALITY PROTEIN: hypothetical protein T552_04068 [Pneumocystis carinii B80]
MSYLLKTIKNEYFEKCKINEKKKDKKEEESVRFDQKDVLDELMLILSEYFLNNCIDCVIEDDFNCVINEILKIIYLKDKPLVRNNV